MSEHLLSDAVVKRCGYLANSYARWLGKPLLENLPADPRARAQALYDASVVIVSHGTEVDPVFWFANRQAQQLWDMDWDTFTQLPSRLSAEPDQQSARDALLARAARDGYIDDYSGIRISRTGARFRIADVIIWNVRDDADRPAGQAALFSSWELV